MPTRSRRVRFTLWGAVLGLALVVGLAQVVAYSRQEWPFSTANLPQGFQGPSKQEPDVPATAFWYARRLGIPLGLILGGVAGWFAGETRRPGIGLPGETRQRRDW
jgi:hypothetical protein